MKYKNLLGTFAKSKNLLGTFAKFKYLLTLCVVLIMWVENLCRRHMRPARQDGMFYSSAKLVLSVQDLRHLGWRHPEQVSRKHVQTDNWRQIYKTNKVNSEAIN